MIRVIAITPREDGISNVRHIYELCPIVSQMRSHGGWTGFDDLRFDERRVAFVDADVKLCKTCRQTFLSMASSSAD